jgi:hypothetical protein
MPNRRHPSRFVVFKRSSMWKNGTGDSEPTSGGPPGIFATTSSTFHVGFACAALNIPAAPSGQLTRGVLRRRKPLQRTLRICDSAASLLAASALIFGELRLMLCDPLVDNERE